MRRKTFTVLLLADGQSRFRRLRVTSRTLLVAGAVTGLLLVLGAAGLAARIAGSGDGGAFDRLQAENASLRAEKARFEETLAGITGRLNRFEAHATRMARELGIDDFDADEPAAGGPGDGTPPSVLDAELAALGARTVGLDESLAALEESFRERIQVLSATPNLLPVDGWFSHGFGWRKDPWSGDRQFHRGIDIVADQGTSVMATADGLVSRTARVADYGKVIDLSHGQGYVTRYAHLSEILVKPGQRVKRGDLVGRVGSTGRSTGPHLHYEVFRDGRRVNPWKYLGQR